MSPSLVAGFQKCAGVRAPTGVEATAKGELEGELEGEQEGEQATDRPAHAPGIGEVFDAHAAYVGRALACLGVHDRELPDACQEVFLVVARRLDDFEGRSSVRTWLYAICLRVALRVKRRAGRRREDAVAQPPEPPGRSSTPQEEVEKRRALTQALSILDELDEDKRAVFVLYEVEQLPMREVARVVGCPLQTAYSRLYAARRQVAATIRRRREGEAR